MKTKLSGRILSMLLCLLMVVSLLPAQALAEDGADFSDAEEVADETVVTQEPAAIEGNEEVIEESYDAADAETDNPAEWTDMTDGEAEVPEFPDSANVDGVEISVYNEAAFADADTVYSTPQAAADYIRGQMVNREAEITISFETPVEDYSAEADAFIAAVWPIVEQHTGVPNQGDYLERNYGGYRVDDVEGRYNADSTKIIWKYAYTITYYTTAEQEQYVSTRVNEIFNELGIFGMQSDYEKIEAIYTWICSNVTYDNEHVNDNTYKLQYTAYAALANKTAVCQGYSNLFYYMALTAGIDARYIAGIGGSGSDAGPHGWNIVKLGDRYYNLDTTWDANYGSDFSSYEYFLKSSDTFPDHTRYDKYTTDEFNTAYPMAATAYPVVFASGTCGDNLTWQYCNGGILKISGSGDMSDYDTQTVTYSDGTETTISTAPWASRRTAIKTVNVAEGVTTIGDYAFFKCSVTAVTLPEGLTSIGASAFSCCSVKAVTLPSTLTSIGASAFYYCDMTEVNLPAALATIGDDAFDKCVYLAAFTVDAANTTYSALNGVLLSKDQTTLILYPAGNTATSYEIPGTVTEIAASAFGRAANLTELTIPNSVTTIGVYAFWNCSGLTELDIPGSVTTIYNYAFSYCSNLKSLGFLGDVPLTVGLQMFDGIDGMTVYYPTDGKNWELNKDNYGGTDITWSSFIRGDCNLDGVVSVNDLAALKDALKDDNFSNIYKFSADLSRDGAANLKDLLMLKRQLATAA